MNDDISLARRTLQHLYGIEVDEETGARVTDALKAMADRLVEPLAGEPAPVEGFEAGTAG